MASKVTAPFVNAETATKNTYRTAVWDHLEANNLSAFPKPVHHRIPNFKGAANACDRCATLAQFECASVIKVNPDKPQQQTRFLALQAGKTVLVPTPRLRSGLFNQLVVPPNPNNSLIKRISSSEGVRDFSKPIDLESKIKIDLIVIGSVAVSLSGHRIGKGEGYADLEFAMMRSMGAVDSETPVVSTVHDCQVFEELPDRLFDPDTDLPVDVICTPTRIIECSTSLPKPRGICWSKLKGEKLSQIPVLRRLREMERKRGSDVTLACD